MNTGTHKPASVIGTLTLVAGLALGSAASFPALAAPPALSAVERLEASRATAILEDLQRPTGGTPPSAAASVIPVELRYANRRHIGVDLPEGVVKGSAAWFDAKLITIEDAEVTTAYYDIQSSYYIHGGYEYPTAAGQDRKPWLEVIMPEHGIPARCEIVVASRKLEGELKLLEVVAIDSDRIYLTAASDDGEEFLVAASYSFETRH